MTVKYHFMPDQRNTVTVLHDKLTSTIFVRPILGVWNTTNIKNSLVVLTVADSWPSFLFADHLSPSFLFVGHASTSFLFADQPSPYFRQPNCYVKLFTWNCRRRPLCHPLPPTKHVKNREKYVVTAFAKEGVFTKKNPAVNKLTQK